MPDGPVGVAVIDKPYGMTSHQVVSRLRRILGTRKIGHAGTLDPMATGVLVCGVNRATRLLGYLMLGRKAYTATIRLGAGTVTDDAEGEITASPGAAEVTADAVRDLLGDFTGDIEQVPTQVSAVKIDGVRSYARVRRGQEVALQPRPVTVHRFELLDSRRVEQWFDVDVVVECSSGTYIRALARDLGDRLGCRGHLTALRRTAVGPYRLDRAQPLSQDTSALSVIDIDQVARENFTCLTLAAPQAAMVRHGRRLDPRTIGEAISGTPGDHSPVALFDGTEFLALYRPDGRAEAVFAQA